MFFRCPGCKYQHLKICENDYRNPFLDNINNITVSPEPTNAEHSTLYYEIIGFGLLVALLCVSCSGGSKGGRERRAPPPAQNFFIFMQFSGKIGQIIGWRPPFGVSAPSSGKSWIRHCHAYNQKKVWQFWFGSDISVRSQ